MFRAREICDKVDLGWLEGKRIMITGATGLIGAHLMACLRYLLDEGMAFSVHGQSRSVLSSFMHKLTNHRRITMFQRDFTGETMDGMPKCDAVIHAAGYAQAQRFMLNPIASIRIGTSVLLNLLNHLCPNGRLLFLSSSAVYSGGNKDVYTENDAGLMPMNHPRIAYVEAKRAGEVICHIYRDLNIDTRVVRLGVTYGPGTHWDDTRALNSFVRAAVTDGRIRLLDSGSTIHQYCYVSDAVEILWQVLLHGREAVYNVGGHDEVSIMGIARTVMSMTGAWLTFPTTPSEVLGAPQRVLMDTTRAETEFGKTDYVGLEEGIQDTIDWYRELHGNRQ